MADAPNWLDDLNARLIWVVGKGGVGKSTCAGAIATGLAESRKVCVVSTDPAGSLSEIMGTAVGAQARAISDNLFARQIDALAEYDRLREQYRSSIDSIFASIGLETSAQLDRRVLESLWDFAPPGIDEIIALIEIMDHADEFDTLVIDSAPTGHFLRLLQMPDIALQWVHALLRLLVKYGAVAHLDNLAQDVLALAKRLRQLHADLSNKEITAVFVVTLPEPMVRAETARLVEALTAAGVPIEGMILNRADDGTRERERFLAPTRNEEITGPAALRAFLSDWTITP
jgi:arsenite/tail-anchored protein-transporting ATPase